MGLLAGYGKVLLSYVVLAVLGVVVGRELARPASAGTDAHAFTITSSAVSGIAPGRPMTFPVLLTNPNAQAIRVLTLSTTVAVLASPPAPPGAPACDVSKLTVAPYNAGTPGAPRYVVPGRGTATVPLTIALADTTTNQNGCKSRRFTLTYSGTAEQVH